MYLTSPFHPRLAEANTTGLWGRWASYVSAPRYDTSAKHEYFAIRNSVGYFDSSPLFKYWIRGADAEKFLAGVLARDIRLCPPGKAQYTFWCDDRGMVLEDGVVFRHSPTEFFLTAAEPNAGYFSDLIGKMDVEVVDVLGGLRRTRCSRSTFARAAVSADERRHEVEVLRALPDQDRQGSSDPVSNRLHGRSRL